MIMTTTNSTHAETPATQQQHNVEATRQSERPRSSALYRPAVDVLQTEDAVVLVADMPGVDEAGVDLSLERNQLTIRGTVHPVNLPDSRLTYAEYGVGDFERTFTLSDEIDRSGIEATINRVGSMMTLFFGVSQVANADQARQCHRQQFASYFHGMLRRGIYLPPSPFEAMFLSTAHTSADLDRTIRAFRQWAQESR